MRRDSSYRRAGSSTRYSALPVRRASARRHRRVRIVGIDSAIEAKDIHLEQLGRGELRLCRCRLDSVQCDARSFERTASGHVEDDLEVAMLPDGYPDPSDERSELGG